MSIHLDEILAESDKTVVKINVTGLSQDNNVAEGAIQFRIYAYDKSSGQSLFTSTAGIEQIRKVYFYLNGFSLIKDTSSQFSGKFVEADGELLGLIEQLKTIDSDLLKKIFEKMRNEDRIRAVLENFSDEDLEHLEAARKQTQYKKELDNLSKLLQLEGSDESNFCKNVEADSDLKKYEAGQPEKIFQNWIEQNLWAVDGGYIKKHDGRKIGLNSESDLVMETSDGFIDLIELKRPCAEIFKHDASHDCFYPSPDLSLVIGQSLHYLKILDEYKAILEKEYKVKVLKPRILVFIGRSNSFDEKRFETLRMLNSNLNHIKILSFDYILSTGQRVIECYEESAK